MRKIKSARRYIRCTNGWSGWQPMKMAGRYPIGTGHWHKRDFVAKCLFRRTVTSHSIRWDRTHGERKEKAVE